MKNSLSKKISCLSFLVLSLFFSAVFSSDKNVVSNIVSNSEKNDNNDVTNNTNVSNENTNQPSDSNLQNTNTPNDDDSKKNDDTKKEDNTNKDDDTKKDDDNSKNIDISTDSKDYNKVLWVNYDNEEIYSETISNNTTPTFLGATPEKPSDDNYLYEFVGWDKIIDSVNKKIIYKAKFVNKEYGIYYNDEQGELRFISWDECIINKYFGIRNNSMSGAPGTKTNIGTNIQYVISNEVTSIGAYSFCYFDNVTSIFLPTSITSLDVFAFYSLSKLESLSIPSSITNLPDRIFVNCSSLTDIKLNEKIQTIPKNAFNGCSSLTELKIPQSVTTINAGAFNNCKSLKKLYIPKNVSFIDTSDTLLSSDDSLTSIEVDKENQYFDSRDNCNAIIDTSTDTLIVGCQTTIIPVNVDCIGQNAFANIKSLTNIDVPDTVKAIDPSAFSGCDNLITNSYLDGNYIGNANNPYRILVSVNNASKLTSFSFHEDTEVVCNRVLSNALLVSTLYITKNIINFAPNSFHKRFSEIIVSDENPKYDSRDYCSSIIETATNTLLVGGSNTYIPDSIEAIGPNAFERSNLKSIEIPSSVKKISRSAFLRAEMENIILNEGLEEIDSYCFDNCNKLKSITLPSTIKHIGTGAFFYCSQLATATFADGTKSLPENIFECCLDIKDIYLPSSLEIIDKHLIYGVKQGSITFYYPDTEERFKEINKVGNITNNSCFMYVFCSDTSTSTGLVYAPK